MSAPSPACPPHAPRPSYAAVLRVPHARRTFAAALTGRLSYGTVSPAVLLTVARATGSYAVAGTVMALFGAATVLLLPLRAALVDRYGPRRTLLPMATLYGVLLCLLAAVAGRPGAPVVVLGAVAALTGACAPPLGSAMRSVWAQLVPDRDLLRRAYSLDGVAEELLYVIGPLAVGAVLITAGTCAFVTSTPLAGAHVVAGGRATAGAGARRGLRVPVAVAAVTGFALGAVSLLVTAFAAQRGHGDGAVPYVLAALSVGSAVGGLLNGALNWRTPARNRLSLSALGLGASLAAAGLAQGLWTLTAALAGTGLFVAPALTTAYLVADEAAAPGARTRAGAWVNMAVNAGSSTGALTAGLLVGRLPPGLCFALSGAVAAATGVASTIRCRPARGRREPDPQRPEPDPQRREPDPQRPEPGHPQLPETGSPLPGPGHNSARRPAR
ncbi:MFS transporter [Streptomyces sp. NPDC005423]|uniref:MFS transporter n=1 Tax=Streptomyces sp. NPDC005423 TaxID=3155343 RepID=UPI0033A87EBE